MEIIGVTGGVGAGKSRVLAYLEEHYPAAVLRADEVSHELMKKGQRCYAALIRLFADEADTEDTLPILEPDGELSRKAMAVRIFGNTVLREKVNAILHPAVREAIQERLVEAEHAGRQFFFLEAALLIEEKYDAVCRELWYVYADEDVRRERLKNSRGYSDEKTASIIKSQLDEQTFRSHADFVLDNSGSFEKTEEQIRAHMAELMREKN